MRLPILLVVSWSGKINYSLSPFASENLVSRDGFGSPVPRQPALSPYSGWIWRLLTTGFLPSSAEASIYLFKPPYAIGSVPSLSGDAFAYRWHSLPRAHRHMASKPQGSSKRVLPWQVAMDQLICASLSHTHYWYKKRNTASRIFLILVSASTESSLGGRNFIQKHIVKKRGRCRELLASMEFADCAPSLSVLVYPRENRRGCLGENLPHKKGVSPARASPISAFC